MVSEFNLNYQKEGKIFSLKVCCIQMSSRKFCNVIPIRKEISTLLVSLFLPIILSTYAQKNRTRPAIFSWTKNVKHPWTKQWFKANIPRQNALLTQTFAWMTKGTLQMLWAAISTLKISEYFYINSKRTAVEI